MLVCWVFANSARALVVQLPHGQVVGITPRAGVAPASIAGARAPRIGTPPADTGVVDYHGGPVAHASVPYLIFWAPTGWSIPSATQALLTRYFTDVALDSGRGLSTNVYGVLRQYTDATGFADYAQGTPQVIADTDPFPAPDTTNCVNSAQPDESTCITNAQLHSELTHLIAVNQLPTDGSSSNGLAANAPIYFIVTPASVNVCASSGDCADTTFCAYHGNYVDGARNNVLYASIPLLNALITDPANGLDPKFCQSDGNAPVEEPNGDGGDVALKYLSHEDAETITDPLNGTGWWDTRSGNEIGDSCNATGPVDFPAGTDPNAFLPTLGGDVSGTLYDQLINGDKYYLQSEWSNGAVDCQMQPAVTTLSPAFTTPSGNPAAGRPVSFDPSSGAPAAGYSSVTWSFGDGGTAFTTGNAFASHTYAAAGPYTVTLTAVDTLGNVASASQAITVRTPPTASFTMPAARPLAGSAVPFDAGGSSDPNGGGLSYNWSFGDGSTATAATPTLTHTYALPGIYTVQLTVTDNFGLVSSPVSSVLQVIGPPLGSFTVSPATPRSAHVATFDARASTDPNSGGQVVSYSWSFGDGATATGATASHTYALAGVYTASLTVTDNFGLSARTSQSIVVTRRPISTPGKPSVSHASLTFVHGTPKLTFVLTAGRNAPALGRFVIRLPAGLRFAGRHLATGLSVKDAGGRRVRFTDRLSHGRLTITLSSASAAVRVKVGGSAIIAAGIRPHKANPSRTKSLRIAVIAIDLAGKRTPLTLRFRL